MIIAISKDVFCESNDGTLRLVDGAREFFDLAAKRHIKLLVLADTGASKGKQANQMLKFWKARLQGIIPEYVTRLDVVGYPSGGLATRLRGNNVYLCVVMKCRDIEQVRGMTRTLIYDSEDNRIPEFAGYERAYNMWGVIETVRSMFARVDRENIRRKRMEREKRNARGARL